MQDIKFKAWDKENKKIINVARMDISDGTLREHLFSGEFLDYWNDVILMQYTGQKDRFSEDIYAGYILECKLSSGKLENYYIRFNQEKCCFECTNKNNTKFISPETWKKFKVVGNIYENYGLL